MQRSVAAIEKVLKNRCQSSMVSGFDYFQLGTSSMNSNVTGEGDEEAVKKMSESQTKPGNQEYFAKLAFASFANLQDLQIDPWDMLNNFCFHVYAQKSLFIGENVNGFF